MDDDVAGIICQALPEDAERQDAIYDAGRVMCQLLRPLAHDRVVGFLAGGSLRTSIGLRSEHDFPAG